MGCELLRRPPANETRLPQELWAHYQIERELAARLAAASRMERKALYSSVYEELFRRVPDHPQLRRKMSAERGSNTAAQLAFLDRFLTPATVFLEIGAGDCALSFAVAARTKKVYGLDVSAEITKCDRPPPNFELVLSDGTNILVPEGSIHVAYSFQLMEHLHPDDAVEQLRNIYNALAPGGIYVCLTPNRVSGPHDISRYFAAVANGLHLKEYTAGELSRLFRHVGFRKIRTHFCLRSRSMRIPIPLLRTLEALVSAAPASLRAGATRSGPLRAVLGLQIVGRR